jgi:hypothetical protein
MGKISTHIELNLVGRVRSRCKSRGQRTGFGPADTNFSAPTNVHEFAALASEAAEAPQNELARIVLRGALSLSNV